MRLPRGCRSGERKRSVRRVSPAKTTQLPGVEVLAGEHAQLGEDAGERFLSLVDDEHRAGQSGGDVLGPASAESFEAAPAVVGLERDVEELTELAVEVHGTRLRVLDSADDDVAQGVEAMTE
jgi:hypothetical protein